MFIRRRGESVQDELEQGGPILRRLIGMYEWAARLVLQHPVAGLVCVVLIVAAGVGIYSQLETDFLPEQDEGAFVLDYFSRPGTSLAETDRMLRHVEEILRDTPEIESYSRRTGARLALAIAEPNTGDFLVKLKVNRSRSTAAVIDDLRERIQAAEPALNTEFPGVLSDLIGDLTWSPDPIEIKIFTNDTETLKQTAARIASEIEQVPGVVDVNDGLVVAGPSLRFRVRSAATARAELDATDIGENLETAMLGAPASYILEGDRTKAVRVVLAHEETARKQRIGELPVRSGRGTRLTLNDVARVDLRPGRLERHREDLRELIAVSGRLSGRDLGSGIAAIKKRLSKTLQLPAGVSIEYGGLYQQQRESFANLLIVLVMAILLVYGVLLLEFRTVLHPMAIVGGAVLALFGVVGALWLADISLNIVSFLGAIIGIGIVAKNGILMFDYVDHLRARGLSLVEALVQSGRRRLRPVLMTSMAALLGLLPLAYGVGAGADMLRPLAIAVIGALCISLVLSLLATPLFYFVFLRILGLHERQPAAGLTKLEAGA